MAEYIKRNLAKAEFTGNFQNEYPVCQIHALIDCVPAADVRENVRDAWVHGRETAREMLGDNTAAIFYEDYSCSSCGFKIDTPLWNWDGSLVYKFCPNCGAQMEVSDD